MTQYVGGPKCFHNYDALQQQSFLLKWWGEIHRCKLWRKLETDWDTLTCCNQPWSGYLLPVLITISQFQQWANAYDLRQTRKLSNGNCFKPQLSLWRWVETTDDISKTSQLRT